MSSKIKMKYIPVSWWVVAFMRKILLEVYDGKSDTDLM